VIKFEQLFLQVSIPGLLGRHIRLGPSGACVVCEGLARMNRECEHSLAIYLGGGCLLIWKLDDTRRYSACGWVLRCVPDGEDMAVFDGGEIGASVNGDGCGRLDCGCSVESEGGVDLVQMRTGIEGDALGLSYFNAIGVPGGVG